MCHAYEGERAYLLAREHQKRLQKCRANGHTFHRRFDVDWSTCNICWQTRDQLNVDRLIWCGVDSRGKPKYKLIFGERKS